MNTVAGRTLYRLLTDNLFVTAASFESGNDDIMISYPWGGLNHRTQNSENQYVSLEAPDFKAYQALGSAMMESAGDDIAFLESGEVIEKYELGDAIMASYPQEGQLIDWAYAAAWDTVDSNAVVSQCFTQTNPPLATDFYDVATTNVRTAFFQIESHFSNNPNETFYGARDIVY